MDKDIRDVVGEEFTFEVNNLAWGSADINFDLLLRNYSKEDIDNYINAPMQYHNELCDVCEVMFNSCGVFAQTISKMAALPTLDYVLIPKCGNSRLCVSGVTDEAVEKHTEAEKIIKALNHSLLTRDSLSNHLLYGESVYILQAKKKGAGCVMLKPLDNKYIRFEGTARGDHIVSFDMSYFDDAALLEPRGLAGILSTYPPEFIKAYERYKANPDERWYILPQETTFATKFRANLSERHGRPLALAALTDMLFAHEYLESQRSNLQRLSSELVYLIHPEGVSKGSCSINDTQQMAQFTNLKSALRKQTDRSKGYSPQATTVSLAPGTVVGKLDVNPALLKDTLKKENNEQIASDLGLGIGAINGNGGTGNYASLSLNMDLVMAEIYQYLEQAGKQYEKIINAYLKTDEDTYVKFRYLKTSGINRKEVFANAKDLYSLSGGSRMWLYAAAMGDSQTYLDLMEFERSMGYDEKYLPHITSFTATDRADDVNPNGNIGGRPEKDAKDMTEKGLGTRTDGSNNAVKPSVK